MKEIIFYDSGIGGIALLNKTKKLAKRENYIYFADNKNMPYGDRGKDEIVDIAIKNLEKLITTKTKCVAIACNTITSKGIDKLRTAFSETQIFGIEPELKTAEKLKLKTALLIATPQTCEATQERINQMNQQTKITVHQAGNLAKIIESEISNKEEIYREIQRIKRSHAEKFQAVILGCTHYALVRDVFEYAFPENTKIFDGINGTAKNISRSIEKEKVGFGSLRLILTKDDMAEKLKYASLIN